jgi:protein gp37
LENTNLRNMTIGPMADIGWHPVSGCSPTSPGCDHCKSAEYAIRHENFNDEGYTYARFVMGEAQWTRTVVEHDDRLWDPAIYPNGSTVYVSPHADLFHPGVTDEFIGQVMECIVRHQGLRFILCTKRSDRMADWFFHSSASAEVAGISYEQGVFWPPANLSLGVSVECQRTADARIGDLVAINAPEAFVMVEPILGPVSLEKLGCPGMSGSTGMCPVCDVEDEGECIDGIFNGLDGHIDWAIVCQEVGPHARDFNPNWIINLIEEGESNKVPIYYKESTNGRREKRGRGSLPVVGGGYASLGAERRRAP